MKTTILRCGACEKWQLEHETGKHKAEALAELDAHIWNCQRYRG